MPDSDLDDLQKRIDEAKARERQGQPSDNASGQAMGSAMRMVTELVAGLLVGGTIGFWIDRWLGTLPWFSIVCFFLGAAAGFRNIRREITKGND